MADIASAVDAQALRRGVAGFLTQARWCEELGSPFTAALLRRCAGDILADGPIAQLLGADIARPSADAVSLRLAGALHAAVLSERAPELAALYPAQQRRWSMDLVFAHVRSLAQEQAPWLRAFMAHAPQTNETRRAIALLPAFVAALAPGYGVLHLLELGASAGLNLFMDRFAYRTRAWAFGRANEGAPVVDCDWSGAAPNLRAGLPVASRAGCDLNPLDVRDADHMLRLRAFVWADQRDRMDRLNAAAALARACAFEVEQADAADFLERRLAAPLPDGLTVVFHSIAWVYFSAQTRARAEAAIRAAGAGANGQAGLAWVRFEHARTLFLPGDDFWVELVEFPSGATRRIARADPHGRFVESLL